MDKTPKRDKIDRWKVVLAKRKELKLNNKINNA